MKLCIYNTLPENSLLKLVGTYLCVHICTHFGVPKGNLLLLQFINLHSVSSGKVILKQGHPPSGFYFLLSGASE